MEADIPVNDVTKINRLIGIGTTLHKLKNYYGRDILLLYVLYHLPQTEVQLFSPKTYHQIHGGYSSLNGYAVEMHFKGNRVVIPICGSSNSLQLFCIFKIEKGGRPTHPL